MTMKRVIMEESGDSGSEEVEDHSSSENEELDDEKDSSHDENNTDEEGDVESNENNIDKEKNDERDDNNADEEDNDDDSNEEVSNNEDESDTEAGSKNAAWADSVLKILKSKPKGDKALVLSKAKKLNEVKAKPKEAGFEVVQGDGNIKKEIVEDKPVEKEIPTKPKEKRKKEIPGLRVKPNVLEKDRERALVKIATRGVVQLFNAVKNQQADITNKLKQAGPLEVRKEKVMKSIDKNAFLDTLMGQKSQSVDEVSEKIHLPKKRKLEENEESTNKVWDVLKDNYMMDAKMRDWDKELELEEEVEEAMETA